MTQTQIPSEVKIGTLPPAEITGAAQALNFARSIIVSSQAEYSLAAEELKAIKARYDRIEEQRQTIKKPVLEAGRAIDAFFNNVLEPLKEAERIVKRTMLTFREEEERKAEEARRKRDEEIRAASALAEKKAREAREKAEAEARRQREEAERKSREADEAARREREAKNEAERKRAAEERRRLEEEERKARERAATALERGEEKAQSAMNTAAEVAAQPLPVAAAPTAKGASVRRTFKARVKDLRKLVNAVAADKTPITAVMGDQKALDKAAASLQGELEKFYPGVEAVETTGLAVRT